MSKEIDEEFLRCCLEEVRDGERVTIETSVPSPRIWAALGRLGATEEELKSITVVRLGSAR